VLIITGTFEGILKRMRRFIEVFRDPREVLICPLWNGYSERNGYKERITINPKTSPMKCANQATTRLPLRV
jgi:hypothetical protein